MNAHVVDTQRGLTTLAAATRAVTLLRPDIDALLLGIEREARQPFYSGPAVAQSGRRARPLDSGAARRRPGGRLNRLDSTRNPDGQLVE